MWPGLTRALLEGTAEYCCCLLLVCLYPTSSLDSAHDRLLRDVGGWGPLVLRTSDHLVLSDIPEEYRMTYKMIKEMHSAEWPTRGRSVLGCAEQEARPLGPGLS